MIFDFRLINKFAAWFSFSVPLMFDEVNTAGLRKLLAGVELLSKRCHIGNGMVTPPLENSIARPR
jgi:hypothetical protein